MNSRSDRLLRWIVHLRSCEKRCWEAHGKPRHGIGRQGRQGPGEQLLQAGPGIGRQGRPTAASSTRRSGFVDKGRPPLTGFWSSSVVLADGLPRAGGALTLAVPHPIIDRRTWLWRAETGAVIEALDFAGGTPVVASPVESR